MGIISIYIFLTFFKCEFLVLCLTLWLLAHTSRNIPKIPKLFLDFLIFFVEVSHGFFLHFLTNPITVGIWKKWNSSLQFFFHFWWFFLNFPVCYTPFRHCGNFLEFLEFLFSVFGGFWLYKHLIYFWSILGLLSTSRMI